MAACGWHYELQGGWGLLVLLALAALRLVLLPVGLRSERRGGGTASTPNPMEDR